MANYRAEIITMWTGTGTNADAYRPQLAEDYTLISWQDSTGQPVGNLMPAPNMYLVVCEVDLATLTAIDNDPMYAVLWSEEIKGA